MNSWLVAEPVGFGHSDVIWKIYSENAILSEYWDYWSTKMISYNKVKGIPEHTDVTHKRCIEDWVVVNWATLATKESIFNIIEETDAESTDYSNC